MKTITLPFVGGSSDSNKYLGYIFGGSSYSANATSVPTALKEVVISDACTSIGASAFYQCTSITSIVIGNNVSSIGYDAFYKCSNLTSVTIGNGLKSIGSEAFYYCSKLQKVYFSGTIENWCGISFYDEFSNPMSYASYFYTLNDSNKYTELTSVVIPDTVIKIGKYQFYGFDRITSMKISDSVKSFGSEVLYGCSSIVSLTIPLIGDGFGFYYNFGYIFGAYSYTNNNKYVPASLKEVIISDACTSISNYAFYNCSNITSIVIGKGVKTIGTNAFTGCTSLETITLPFVGDGTENNTYFGYLFGGTSYSDNGSVIPSTLRTIILSDTCTRIESNAFYNLSNVTEIYIPSSVTYIGANAFRFSTNLTIYYEGSEIPASWDSKWNSGNRPVVFNYGN